MPALTYPVLTCLTLSFSARFSDNCAAQFKSQYTMQKMMDCPTALGLDCPIIHWQFYEPDHGGFKHIVEMFPMNHELF